MVGKAKGQWHEVILVALCVQPGGKEKISRVKQQNYKDCFEMTHLLF